MKSLHLKTEPHHQKESISDDFESLELFLSEQGQESPDNIIDKQIIAAAHREIQNPREKIGYRTGWWRRLSLPLYVTAGFTFTVFAFKSLWLPPVYFVEQGADQTTSVIFNNKPVEVHSEVPESGRIERELPELIVAPNELMSNKNNSPVSDYKQSIHDDFVQPINKEDIYTGNQFVKAAYPEKEAWARKIIDFMRNDNIDAARSELVRFKKVYPNYPIEEQIKVLVQ